MSDNDARSVNVAFTKCHGDTLKMVINNKPDPKTYNGFQLDNRLTWKPTFGIKEKNWESNFQTLLAYRSSFEIVIT